MIKKIFLIFLFSYSVITFAEYRVYQYMIRDNKRDVSSVVSSSLAPQSFVAYHGGSSNMKVDLIKTWRCMGDTSGHTPLCLPPESKMVVTP
jgi:hypothetical protein